MVDGGDRIVFSGTIRLDDLGEGDHVWVTSRRLDSTGDV